MFTVESNSWGEGAWLVNGPGFSVSIEPQGDEEESFAQAEQAARALAGALNSGERGTPVSASLANLAAGRAA